MDLLAYGTLGERDLEWQVIVIVRNVADGTDGAHVLHTENTIQALLSNKYFTSTM